MSDAAEQQAGRRGSARSIIRAAVQVAGFVLGLGALAWCVSLALKPGNREQLGHLAEAPVGSLLALLGLTAASIVLNGLIFWATLLPVRRLRVADVLAVNALATFLAYLPFKLGAVARAFIHNRRDRVPVAIIGAWFGAVGALMMVALLPPAAAILWRPRIDGAWAATTAGGIVLLGGAVLVVSRWLRGERGLARMHAMLDRMSAVGGRPAQRLLRSRLWGHLHEGFTILSSPGVVVAAIALRLADAGLQAARFVIAATILGQTLAVEQAVIVAVTFFLIGVLSPTGMLGLREAGAAGLAGIMAFATSEEFAPVALLVGGSEAVVNVLGAAVGLAWLRPHRLLTRRGELADAAP